MYHVVEITHAFVTPDINFDVLSINYMNLLTNCFMINELLIVCKFIVFVVVFLLCVCQNTEINRLRFCGKPVDMRKGVDL